MKKPLFSIITVNLNNKKGLEKTIKSVIKQSCKDYEYIVIDGKSTDRSLDVIKKYEYDIDYWVNEKDGGIYDAMNKGIRIGKGQLVFFLNSGDTFYNEKVLEEVKVFYIGNNQPWCLYGGINYINPFKGIEYTEIIKEKITLSKIKLGKMIRHQSLFVHRSIFHKIGLFDLDYGLAGDFEFECRLFTQDIECVYVDKVISNFYGGGAGSNLSKAFFSKGEVIKDNWGYKRYVLFLFSRGLRLLFTALINSSKIVGSLMLKVRRILIRIKN